MGLLDDRRGAGLAEYLIAVGLVAILVLVGFRAFGEVATAKAEAQAACVSGLGCGQGAAGEATGMLGATRPADGAETAVRPDR